jgi:hypothetical protein
VYSLDNPPVGVHSLLHEVCARDAEAALFTENYSVDCEMPKTIQSALSAGSTRLSVCDAFGNGGGEIIGLTWRIGSACGGDFIGPASPNLKRAPPEISNPL